MSSQIMRKKILFLSVLGMGVVQTSDAASEISNTTLTYSRANIVDSNQLVTSKSLDSLRLRSELLKAEWKREDDERRAKWKREDDERKNEEEKVKRELAKKPNAKIGMTTDQILNKSNWGKPDDINTTIDAYGKFEQWVYEDNQYLYFKNGKLTSIQY